MKSEARQKIYDYIIEYIKEYGFPPSVREICQGVGLSSTSSVYSHLCKLDEEGKIEIRGKSPRAIRVIGFEFVEIKEVEEEQTETEENNGEGEKENKSEEENTNGESEAENKEDDDGKENDNK